MFRGERLPFMMLGLLALITGLLAGLQRIGWPFVFSVIAPHHGAIMIGGFLGTLITLEKIIPLKHAILYTFPLIASGSVLFFWLDMPGISMACLLVASAGLSLVFVVYWIRERSIVYAISFIGALCWLVGNAVLAFKGIYPAAVSWWMAFVLLTITAERLELTKFLPVPAKLKLLLYGALMAFVIACIFSFHGVGMYFALIGISSVAIWLMRHDVASLNIRKRGLTRFIGCSLLCGYMTLLLCGFLLPAVLDHSFGYDIVVHLFFIGFVFSMIFAHGPVILPGVLGLQQNPFHKVMYFWLLLLHTSWIVRLVGNMMMLSDVRHYSGVGSALAIVGYFITLAITAISRARKKGVPM